MCLQVKVMSHTWYHTEVVTLLFVYKISLKLYLKGKTKKNVEVNDLRFG